MRVTDAMRLKNWMRNLQSTSNRLERAATELASGKSLLKPSDNPTGMSKLIKLNQQIAKLDQYIKAANDGMGWLKTTEVALGAVSDALSQAKEIALEGANGTVTDEQRQGFVKPVEQIIEQVITLANTQYAGRYVFSGEKTLSKPFAVNSTETGIEPYAGGTGTINREIMADDLISINCSGQEVFVDSHVFDALFDLKQALESGDSDSVQNCMDALDSAFNEVVSQRALLGVKINRFTDIIDQHTLQKDQLKIIAGDLEEGDTAEIITNLSIEQTAYEAALAVGAQINRVSLLDYL